MEDLTISIFAWILHPIIGNVGASESESYSVRPDAPNVQSRKSNLNPQPRNRRSSYFRRAVKTIIFLVNSSI